MLEMSCQRGANENSPVAVGRSERGTARETGERHRRIRRPSVRCDTRAVVEWVRVSGYVQLEKATLSKKIERIGEKQSKQCVARGGCAGLFSGSRAAGRGIVASAGPWTRSPRVVGKVERGHWVGHVVFGKTAVGSQSKMYL